MYAAWSDIEADSREQAESAKRWLKEEHTISSEAFFCHANTRYSTTEQLTTQHVVFRELLVRMYVSVRCLETFHAEERRSSTIMQRIGYSNCHVAENYPN